ncbi:MAG TPA: NAD(P)/FAD-dependent oxidoreductase [Candidatus Polarisedimenticolaceae bacterium]|nr:NAD(P)/FAD-dependent oxidoreductase [Candidatus Polarisedimenticolaceae bacterium]
MSAFDAVVIGAGSNGLVAAARLAKAGRKVLVLERAQAVGGKSRALAFAPGFSAAPFGRDPGWLPPEIASALGLAGLPRVHPRASLTVVEGPGTAMPVLPEAIAARSPADGARWEAFSDSVRDLAGFFQALYGAPAPDVDATGLADLLPLLSLGRKFRALGKRHMIDLLRMLPMAVQELLDDRFTCVPLKAAVATTGVLDLRQGPRSGGTGFVFLHHLVGAPRGAMRGRGRFARGPAAFATAALQAAQRLGATVRTEAEVTRIEVRDDTVAGVVLASGEEIATRAVLSTADPATTFLKWVDPVWLDPEFVRALGNIRHRGCTSFVLYGLDALPDLPGLDGVVSLTPDLVTLERAADAAKYGRVPDRPHVELSAEGSDVLVARVQYAPYTLSDGGSWDQARREALAETVTSMIEDVAPGFRARLRHHAALSPLDLEREFALPEGSPAHGELALDQILFMRPVAGWGRYATPIDGLYLGGSGTHPGPGILGGAGWLAAARMLAR